MNSVSSIAGWVGTVLILSAYFLVSTNRLKGTDKTYQSMNALGAIGVGLNVFNQQAWPALALQVVWLGIAFMGLWKARHYES